MRDVALTTIDNPFNPFTNFDDWYKYDERMGYHSCSYLSSMCVVPIAFTDVEATNTIEATIDDIVKHDPTQKYIKLIRKSESDNEKINQTIKKVNEFAETNMKTVLGKRTDVNPGTDGD